MEDTTVSAAEVAPDNVTPITESPKASVAPEIKIIQDELNLTFLIYMQIKNAPRPLAMRACKHAMEMREAGGSVKG
jgi:hypothetical protein